MLSVAVSVLPTVGDITIPGGVTLSRNTLTCISTGGPATTVTWTRDSVTVTEGNETVLDDPVTAQYTHTLTVTSAGEYTCTVTNDKPSTASASITVPGTVMQSACAFHRNVVCESVRPSRTNFYIGIFPCGV